MQSSRLRWAFQVTVGRKENFEIDVSAAQSAIEKLTPPVRMVCVVHPNSPTGTLTSRELEWLRSLPEQILVVIDEAYFEFSQTSVVSELLQRVNWVLRTFSKSVPIGSSASWVCDRPS